MFFLGDRDFIPLIEAVKNAGKETIGIFFLKNVPNELIRVFDFRFGLSEEHLKPLDIKK